MQPDFIAFSTAATFAGLGLSESSSFSFSAQSNVARKKDCVLPISTAESRWKTIKRTQKAQEEQTIRVPCAAGKNHKSCMCKSKFG